MFACERANFLVYTQPFQLPSLALRQQVEAPYMLQVEVFEQQPESSQIGSQDPDRKAAGSRHAPERLQRPCC